LCFFVLTGVVEDLGARSGELGLRHEKRAEFGGKWCGCKMEAELNRSGGSRLHLEISRSHELQWRWRYLLSLFQ
jgi:hypothetical protein